MMVKDIRKLEKMNNLARNVCEFNETRNYPPVFYLNNIQDSSKTWEKREGPVKSPNNFR